MAGRLAPRVHNQSARTETRGSNLQLAEDHGPAAQDSVSRRVASRLDVYTLVAAVYNLVRMRMLMAVAYAREGNHTQVTVSTSLIPS
jgi:hypothetical protein